MDQNKVKLRLLGITYSQIQKGAYALVLAEENGSRRIPVIIGMAEAQSIAVGLEHLVPPRPLTHDLFVSFVRSFGIRLVEVFIYKYEDGVFSSDLIFEDEDRQVVIDSRTSDAIAIAMRMQVPIYTTESIIAATGIELEQGVEPSKKVEKQEMFNFSQMNKSELHKELERAVKKEEYELAAMIQKELKKRIEKE